VCGEHIPKIGAAANNDGSSPRVWGTYINNERHTLWQRFIPTCVGNMSGEITSLKIIAVHPHVCGEHLINCARANCVSGSSPRVWGTSRMIYSWIIPYRFIPTCVGNISTLQVGKCLWPVHPHVCGEHVRELGLWTAPNGSSPRVWGTSIHWAPGRADGRFIPTCVGNMCPSM